MKRFGLLILSLLLNSETWAAQRISRVYQSARAGAMGGTRITTGLYDDCFFGNPARHAYNPSWRFSLIDGSAETNVATLGRFGDVLAGRDVIQSIASGAGENIHLRGQTLMPAIYVPHVGGTGLSLAGAIFLSSQFDINLRKSYVLTPALVTDAGPVFSAAYAFLKDESLSVGMTISGLYRFSAEKDLTLVELLQGQTFGPIADGREGAHVDVGLGVSYRLPKFLKDWDFEVAATAQNLIGGLYRQIDLRLLTGNAQPAPQPRAFGLGVAARMAPFWKIDGGTIALEFLELGNDGGGSFLRHIHFGTEWRVKFFLARIGLNQGYPGFGAGFDLKTWTLDFAFYGEEMGLNAGDSPDYRMAFRINLQI
jgi:hypothetical protein